jgi:hypothetical protein
MPSNALLSLQAAQKRHRLATRTLELESRAHRWFWVADKRFIMNFPRTEAAEFEYGKSVETETMMSQAQFYADR